MSPETVPRSHLREAIPRLLDNHTVVLLAPAGPDLAWAADAAWELARAAAARGRRVALVDLSVEHPALHQGGGTAEGIVDAFLYGASLHHVAQPRQPTGLYYIPVGTLPEDPPAIWGHARWPRLARGFAKEGALLLLFVPREGWRHFPTSPDRIITLGAPPDSVVMADEPTDEVPGVPISHVVPDRPSTKIETAPLTAWASRSIGGRRPSTRLVRGGTIGIAVVVLVVASMFVARCRSQQRPEPQGSGEVPTEPADPARAAGTVIERERTTDSLYYAVQVASFKTPERALEHAAGYRERGWPVTLVPVRLGLQGLWFRVVVGAFPNAAVADSALRRFYVQGLLERPYGTILRTPHTLVIKTVPDSAGAAAEVEGLRDGGIAAYIVKAPGGHQVAIGAFETPEQAHYMDSILTQAGLAATIATRAGIVQ